MEKELSEGREEEEQSQFIPTETRRKKNIKNNLLHSVKKQIS